ncbi:MAG: hypothetical protein WDM89_08735 [Rhizomicrobium sp.]
MAATLIAHKPPEQDASREAQAIEEKLNVGGRIGHAVGWLYGAIIAPFVDFFPSPSLGRVADSGDDRALSLARFRHGYHGPPDVSPVVLAGEIGTMSGLIGVWVTILGALIGGFFVFRFGIMRSLFIGADRSDPGKSDVCAAGLRAGTM